MVEFIKKILRIIFIWPFLAIYYAITWPLKMLYLIVTWPFRFIYNSMFSKASLSFHWIVHIFDTPESDNPDLYPTFKAINTKPSRAYVFIYLIIIMMVTSFFGWAYMFEVDAYVNARGEVETFSKTSTITSTEAKMIEEIHVKEGDRVKKDQVLVTFDKISEEANKEALEKQFYATISEIARLEAQVENKNLAMPKKILDYSEKIVQDTYKRFLNETSELRDNLNIADQQIIQKNSDIKKIEDQIIIYQEKIDLIEEQVDVLKKLEAQKLVTKLRLIESQKELVDDQIVLDALESDLPRTKSELEELKAQKSQIINNYKNRVGNELDEAKTLRTQLQANITNIHQDLSRSKIVSPIDGTVFRIPNTTKSSSIQAGQEIISIIPFEDSLIVTANVRPEDIGLIQIGQDASVKITAYDYAIYGLLKGKVIQISPETYENEADSKTYFTVKVQTHKNYLMHHEQKYYISPGMIAMTDVIVDKRTVLQYIINPFIKTVRESMSEK